MKYTKWSNIILITILFSFIIGVSAKQSHSVKFYNQSNETVSYHMFQVDHGIKRHPNPMELVTGTLPPSKYWVVNREEGVYFVVWVSEKTHKIILKTERFNLDKNMTFVIGSLP
jgi:uncharacterized protein YpmB